MNCIHCSNNMSYMYIYPIFKYGCKNCIDISQFTRCPRCCHYYSMYMTCPWCNIEKYLRIDDMINNLYEQLQELNNTVVNTKEDKDETFNKYNQIKNQYKMLVNERLDSNIIINYE